MRLPSASSGLAVVYRHWRSCWVNYSRLHATSTVLHMTRLSPSDLANHPARAMSKESIAYGVKYTICEALRR